MDKVFPRGSMPASIASLLQRKTEWERTHTEQGVACVREPTEPSVSCLLGTKQISIKLSNMHNTEYYGTNTQSYRRSCSDFDIMNSYVYLHL